MRRAAALWAMLIPGWSSALVAMPIAGQEPGFTLSPTPSAPPPVGRHWHRLDRLERVPADDRGPVPTIGVRRKTRHFVAEAMIPPRRIASLLDRPRDVMPRSRITALAMEEDVALDDRLALRIGWRGLKVSNGNANVTVGRGRLKLKAHDWFMPRAALSLQAGQGIGLTLGYSQSMSAYGETGSAGPLGLTRGEFEALRDRLRPERRESIRLRAELDPAPDMHVAVSLYGGRIADRLAFADRSYLPETIGSASVRGAAVRATMRVAPGMLWSIGYDRTWFAPALASPGERAIRERDIAMEGRWSGGPWRTSLRVAHGSAPALAGAFAPRRASWRIETGIDYAALRIGRGSLHLFARLSEPSRLAGAAMRDDDAPASLRAQDLARVAKLGTEMAF